VNKTIKKEELNLNIALQLFSIQLECLICSLYIVGYHISPSKLWYRLVFLGWKLLWRPTSIVLTFISKLVGTSRTFLAKVDIFLGSDVAFVAIFRNRTSNFPFKIYERTLSEHGLWCHRIFNQSEDGQFFSIF